MDADIEAWLKIGAGLLTPIGALLGWAYREVRKAQKEHRDCEIELAKTNERLDYAQTEIAKLQGTCGTLTELLKKEIHLG